MTDATTRLRNLLSQEGECLVYTGRINQRGTPVFDLEKGKSTTAQRAYLALICKVPISREHRVIVLCGNYRCVEHLFVPDVKMCRNGHPLGESTSHVDKHGHTRCRRCRANNQRKFRYERA